MTIYSKLDFMPKTNVMISGTLCHSENILIFSAEAISGICISIVVYSPSPLLDGLVTLPETVVLHTDGKKVVNGSAIPYMLDMDIDSTGAENLVPA